MEPRPIMLVEDNADDIELTLRSLKKAHLKNQVVIARDGVEALDLLFGEKSVRDDSRFFPAVILLDLKLPKIDGWTLLQKIREDEVTKCIPVVVLTSSREQEDIIKGYQLHANSYIRKPIGFSEFADVVCQAGLYWALINELPPKV